MAHEEAYASQEAQAYLSGAQKTLALLIRFDPGAVALTRLLTRLDGLAIAIRILADHVAVAAAALRLLPLAFSVRSLTGLIGIRLALLARVTLLLLVLPVLFVRVLLVLLRRARIFGVRLVRHDVILSLLASVSWQR